MLRREKNAKAGTSTGHDATVAWHTGHGWSTSDTSETGHLRNWTSETGRASLPII